MAWLRTGLAVTALAAVAWAGGCGSAETDSSETVGRLIVDEDTGKPIPDVSLAQQLQEAFADPRRYPFTIAVCPLQTDFWDAQEKTPLFDQTLDDPIDIAGYDLPNDRRRFTQAGWPTNADLDSVAVIEALRAGRAAAGESEAAETEAGPTQAGEGGAELEVIEGDEKIETEIEAQPEGGPVGPRHYRQRKIGSRIPAHADLLTPLPACPPPPEDQGAGSQAMRLPLHSRLTYEAPGHWKAFVPEKIPGTLIQAHQAPDGSANIYAAWEPREVYLAPKAPLKTTEAFLDDFESTHLAGSALQVDSKFWELSLGHPAIEIRGRLGDFYAYLRYVFTQDRVFTVSVIASSDQRTQAMRLMDTIDVFGRPIERPEEHKRTEAREVERIPDDYDGVNFTVDPSGFQDRATALLEQFGMFERVEKLLSQKTDRDELRKQADKRGADFMLIATLRRNRVAYTGISGIGSYVADFFTWLLFWFPSDFMDLFDTENYRSDLELQVEIVDVRSGETLWDQPYTASETMALSSWDRGWIPYGILLVRLGLTTDGMFQNAGEYVRPLTWMGIEHQLVADLWSGQGFKAELDASDFSERINDGVDSRRLAVVVGVSKYGPKAAPVLANEAREAYLAAANPAQRKAMGDEMLAEELRDQLRERYGDPTLDYGVRPYAEVDAGDITEFLQNEADFLQANIVSLVGPQATRVGLKAALFRIAKARRPDPTFVYLNLQTIVADDPEAPGDKLRKYLLPYDADLETLEKLRQGGPKTLEEFVNLEEDRVRKEINARFYGGRNPEDLHPLDNARVKDLINRVAGENPSDPSLKALAYIKQLLAANRPSDARTQAILYHLDRTALSMDWVAETFNKEGVEDHRQLQSRENVTIFDCAFPGDVTGLRYAPVHEKEVALGVAGRPTTPSGVRLGPGVMPGAEPEVDLEELMGGDGEAGPGEGGEGEPGEGEPGVEEEPQRKYERRKIGSLPRRLAPTTVFAQQAKEDGDANKKAQPAAVVPEVGKGPQLSKDFLQRISRKPGRKVILTAQFNQPLLDVIPQKNGGFAYHFLKGARDRARVPAAEMVQGGAKYTVLTLERVLAYTRARIEDESRTLNQPQSLEELGDNHDFPLIKQKQQQ